MCSFKVKPMHIYIKCNFVPYSKKPSRFLIKFKTKINFCESFKHFEKCLFLFLQFLQFNMIDEHIILYPSECHIICF